MEKPWGEDACRCSKVERLEAEVKELRRFLIKSLAKIDAIEQRYRKEVERVPDNDRAL